MYINIWNLLELSSNRRYLSKSITVGRVEEFHGTRQKGTARRELKAREKESGRTKARRNFLIRVSVCMCVAMGERTHERIWKFTNLEKGFTYVLVHHWNDYCRDGSSCALLSLHQPFFSLASFLPLFFQLFTTNIKATPKVDENIDDTHARS